MKLMKWRNWYFGLSLAVIIPGLISLFLFGLKPAIDFTGGSLWELQFAEQPDTEKIKTALSTVYEPESISATGEQSVIIRGKTLEPAQKIAATAALNTTFGTVNELRFETVGPVLGKELVQKTLVAIILVSVIITLYIGRQFSDIKFGVSAILAMFHDSLILLGAFSLLGKFMGIEVDVLFVTALLTTLSFSVHDTIVVYDRVRELMRKHPRFSLPEIANAAVLETLGRSINNSMTIIFMLVALVLMGGESIKWFAVALLVGSITGTYSSTFTAVPLLLLWDELKQKTRKK